MIYDTIWDKKSFFFQGLSVANTLSSNTLGIWKNTPLERTNYKINDVPQMSMFCIQICSQGGDRPNTKTLGHNCGSCPHLFKAQQQDWVRWRRDCQPMHQNWGSLNLIHRHLSSDCSSRDPTPSPPQAPQISKIVAKWLPTREWIIEATRTQPSLGWPARG